MSIVKIKSAILASAVMIPSLSALAALSSTAMAAEVDMAAAAEMSDGQIAGAVNVANDQAVSAAKSAQKSATNKNLVGYANSVIRDHERFSAEFNVILGKVAVKAEESGVSAGLRVNALRDGAMLLLLKGADFDKKYLHQHVSFMQDFIELLDTKLIPGAKNPEIKSYLQSMRGDFVKCLESGKALQAEVGV
jgi:putative membrane protein